MRVLSHTASESKHKLTSCDRAVLSHSCLHQLKAPNRNRKHSWVGRKCAGDAETFNSYVYVMFMPMPNAGALCNHVELIHKAGTSEVTEFLSSNLRVQLLERTSDEA